MDRKMERADRFVRTKSVRVRQRQPDFVRKAGPMRSRRAYNRADHDTELHEAIEEWAEDMNGNTIWED